MHGGLSNDGAAGLVVARPCGARAVGFGGVYGGFGESGRSGFSVGGRNGFGETEELRGEGNETGPPRHGGSKIGPSGRRAV